MPTPPAAFRRARSPEHKERRGRDLVDAARTLAAEQGAWTVTLTAIATRAGVHVSGVRRYFDSREDILLTLAGEGWQQWRAGTAAALQPGRGSSLHEQAGVLVDTLAELPLFCDLLGQVPLSLERAATLETVRAVKLVELEQVAAMADALAAAGRLPVDGARELVSATALLAGSLWQAAHPTGQVADLYRDDPRLGAAAVDFVPQLTRHVQTLARGLVGRPGAEVQA